MARVLQSGKAELRKAALRETLRNLLIKFPHPNYKIVHAHSDQILNISFFNLLLYF